MPRPGSSTRTCGPPTCEAGTYTWDFDGRRSNGTMLPPGRYISYVSTTDGILTVAQSVAFEADAF